VSFRFADAHRRGSPCVTARPQRCGPCRRSRRRARPAVQASHSKTAWLVRFRRDVPNADSVATVPAESARPDRKPVLQTREQNWPSHSMIAR